MYPTRVEIYETYNPGAVVQILAADCDPDAPDGNVRYMVCVFVRERERETTRTIRAL